MVRVNTEKTLVLFWSVFCKTMVSITVLWFALLTGVKLGTKNHLNQRKGMLTDIRINKDNLLSRYMQIINYPFN